MDAVAVQADDFRAISRDDLEKQVVGLMAEVMGLRLRIDAARVAARDAALEEAAIDLKLSYPDNASTNAFCAAIRSMKSQR